MQATFHVIETQTRLAWEYGEHTGTITFPADERGPVRIEWDGPCPEDWEEIEERVVDDAAGYIGGGGDAPLLSGGEQM